MRSQRPFQFDVLRSLSCLAHTKHLPPSHPPLSFCSVCLLFSPRSLRFAFVSLRRCNPSVSLVRISYQLGSFSRSLPLVLCVPFAKLRSIFHLEPRRSLAINPRILLRPTGNPIASSSRHPHVGLPGCLLACLCRSSASLRGTTSTIQTRRLSGMRRHSRSLVRRGFSRVPP